jgi:hypothetical protein
MKEGKGIVLALKDVPFHVNSSEKTNPYVISLAVLSRRAWGGVDLSINRIGPLSR